MKDTIVSLPTGNASNYSMLALISLAILGILAHLFFDLVKAKQLKPTMTFKEHLNNSYPSMGLSLIICAVFVTIRHEFMSIPDFTNWEGAATALLGYFGGSVLMPLVNIASSKFGIKTVKDNGSTTN